MSTVGQDLVLPIADAFGFQALLGGLKDPDPEVRLATAQSLGEMTALIVRVVDESALGLRSKAPTEREQAGNDLAVTARQAVRGTVEALVEGLRDGNPAIRRSVATTLGLLGRALAQARATLSDRLRDPDRDVRVSAARALAALGSAVTTTTVALRDAEEREEDEATLLALGKARQGIEDKLAAQKSRR
jgi:HEAT repeat protein